MPEGGLIIGLVLGFYLVRFLQSRPAFQDKAQLLQHDIRMFPESNRPWIYLVNPALGRQDFVTALFYCRRGLEYSPHDCKLLFFMGSILSALGDLDAADEYLRRAQRAHMDPYQQQLNVMCENILKKNQERRGEQSAKKRTDPLGIKS